MGNYITNCNVKKPEKYSDVDIIVKYQKLNDELLSDNNLLLTENKQLEETLVKTKKDLIRLIDKEITEDYKDMYIDAIQRNTQLCKNLRDLRIQKEIESNLYRNKITLFEQHIKDLYQCIQNLDVDTLTETIFKENNLWMIFNEKEKQSYTLAIKKTIEKISEHIYVI